MERVGDVLQSDELAALRRGVEEAKRRLATDGLRKALAFDAELPPDLAKERPMQTLVEAALGKVRGEEPQR